MGDDYRTAAESFRHEIEPIQGSRFLGCVAPAADLEAARRFIEAIRTEFRGATHHCWGARLGHEPVELRSDDDGEPSGSAGRPIARQIEGHELHDLVVVVVRWFGGTKLGVGGLMRAYGGCAGQTLDRAPIRTVVRTRRLTLELPYECSGSVAGLLAAHGLTPSSSEYGAVVQHVLEVPIGVVESFRRELADRTAGRARLE